MNIKGKKQMQWMLFVLIAIATLGIGYAGISAVNAIISINATVDSNQNNFKVIFKSANLTTGTGTATIDSNDETVAYFNVSGLTKAGDSAVATYTIKNESIGVGADIGLKIENSNTEYFQVTEHINDSKLQVNETTTATITVEMIKTPISDSVTASITGTLVATPLENENASGGSSITKVAGEPESFALDSWSTIKRAVQNNNTSLYNVGDTKTVTINNEDYTLRIANKTTNANCSDPSYSETACGFVVEFVDIINQLPMRDMNYPYGSNMGGYPATDVYNYLSNTLFGQLPIDLQNAIKPTRVISSHGSSSYENNFITNDMLYLLSSIEVFGSDSDNTASSTTTQLEYYQNSSNSNIKIIDHSYDYEWWLRSALSTSDLEFKIVSRNGDLNYTYSAYSYGISPAFRIG